MIFSCDKDTFFVMGPRCLTFKLFIDLISIIVENYCELDIIANAILLFAAGIETVSTIGSYCFYELAMNRDIQDRLRAEIFLTKKKYGGKLDNAFLEDLHYAEMVLNGNT